MHRLWKWLQSSHQAAPHQCKLLCQSNTQTELTIEVKSLWAQVLVRSRRSAVKLTRTGLLWTQHQLTLYFHYNSIWNSSLVFCYTYTTQSSASLNLAKFCLTSSNNNIVYVFTRMNKIWIVIQGIHSFTQRYKVCTSCSVFSLKNVLEYFQSHFLGKHIWRDLLCEIPQSDTSDNISSSVGLTAAIPL